MQKEREERTTATVAQQKPIGGDPAWTEKRVSTLRVPLPAADLENVAEELRLQDVSGCR